MSTSQNPEILRMIGDMKEGLGELRGQLRELIHNVNNMSVKIDSLSEKSAQSHDHPMEIVSIKERLSALEIAEQKRNGAFSFGALFLKSPVLAWAVAAMIVIYAKLKGTGYVQ